MDCSLLPEPLIDVRADLRDLQEMPLDINRLLNSSSWLVGARDKRAGFAAMTLWARSWHQVPAGSLPAGDMILASLSMCADDEWLEIKVSALSGFVLCSDGRLYHRTVCEYAAAAWAKKLSKAAYVAAQREHGKRAREQRDPKPTPTPVQPAIAAVAASDAKPVAEIFDPVKAIEAEDSARASKRADIKTIFDHWVVVMGKKRAMLDQKRKKLIQVALGNWSADDLCRAIDGCAASPFHMGQNENSTRYNELSLIFRSNEKIESFLSVLDKPSVQRVASHMVGTLSAMDAVFGSGEQQSLIES